MRQLLQDPDSGEVVVAEVAPPALPDQGLLVRNVASVVSPGTERIVLATGRDSYLKTARARPDLVRKVMDIARKDGVVAAWQRVQEKLRQPRVLGYSCAGTVVAVGPDAGTWFKVGDRVACAGAGFANHADVVAVPTNLAAKVPDGVDLDHAAFATLGAIALHGVRQGSPQLGERWAVIGLGLLGQLTVQLLRAAGVRVAAYDLQPDLVDRALAAGASVGVAGGTDAQVASALGYTDGVGVDGIIVTASSSSDAPMVAAAGMARDRAVVVAVGLVPFGLPREIAYPKELELRIARSYGPGRYDRAFEERGLDYPLGYVRWTETANLEAVLHLVADGRLDIGSLVTRTAPVEDAASVYGDLMAGGTSPLGVVLRYAERVEVEAAPPQPAVQATGGRLGVGFIGGGAFARGTLMPAFAAHDGARLVHVVTTTGTSAAQASERFGFARADTDVDALLASPDVHVVCVATRHDSHASLVVRALQAGKHVFVEKPLALSEPELARVEAAARASDRVLLVGFNRRFAPTAVALREQVANRGAVMVQIRVNAGAIGDHWLNDPEVGGGRLIGEGCHFVDLASFLCGDPGIAAVHAEPVGGGRSMPEDWALTLRFRDGSAGQILYTARGHRGMTKEHVEAFAGGACGTLHDFRSLDLFPGPTRLPLVSRGGPPAGKGHAEEIDALIRGIHDGVAPIPLDVLLEVTRATFVARGQPSAA